MPRGTGFSQVVRSKGVTFLAWTSLVAAFIGGALVAGMFVGTTIRTVLEAIPLAWMPLLILVALAVIFVRDLVVDFEPNRQAIYSLLIIPSIAASTDGKLGGTIIGWSGDALDLVAKSLSEWLGTSAPTALALSMAAVAILTAQRTVKAAPGGMVH